MLSFFLGYLLADFLHSISTYSRLDELIDFDAISGLWSLLILANVFNAFLVTTVFAIARYFSRQPDYRWYVFFVLGGIAYSSTFLISMIVFGVFEIHYTDPSVRLIALIGPLLIAWLPWHLLKGKSKERFVGKLYCPSCSNKHPFQSALLRREVTCHACQTQVRVNVDIKAVAVWFVPLMVLALGLYIVLSDSIALAGVVCLLLFVVLLYLLSLRLKPKADKA